jgi:putative endonuclease
MTQSCRTCYFAGLSAEESVAQTYERAGHQIAARRWRGTAGEVDLILRDGEGLIFVEVKKSRTHAQARHSLGRKQMARIYQTANEFLAGEPHGELTDVRFDVATVDQFGTVDVLENAFMDLAA